MTWKGERRKQLPPGWAALRKRRLELDGYQCTAEMVQVQSGSVIRTFPRCPSPATDVHHALDPHDHRIESLRSLCAWHHQQHTQAEAAEARARKPKAQRPKAKHPGLR